jgi:hypothetical protein
LSGLEQSTVDESKRRFRRKYLTRLAASPATLGPLVGGISAALAAWGLDLSSLVAFGGIAAALAGIGVFLTRLAVPSEAQAKEAAAEVERELAAARDAELDALYERLAADPDPRDERLLADLRTMVDALKDPDLWPENLTAQSTVDITAGVDELFASCVASLERSLALIRLGRKMTTREAREPIRVEREQILEEVGASLRQLSAILTRIQTLRRPGAAPVELGRIRQELDQSLEVAARVEERMNAWRRGHPELEQLE